MKKTKKASNVAEDIAIKNSLVKFKFGFGLPGQVIFMTDKDGKIFYVNSAFTKIYGYTAKYAIGKTPRILKSSVQSNKIYKAFWNVLLKKEVITGEIINKTKNGKLLTMHGSASPILNEKNEITGFLAIQSDITVQKKAQENLIETETRYRALLDSLPLCIKLFDPKGNLFSVNDYGREEHSLVGWTDKQINKWQYLKCIAPEYRSRVRLMMKEAIAGKSTSITFEHTQEHAKGGYCFSNLAPVKIDGKIKYIIFSSLDVTDQKQNERELKKKVEQMEFIGRANLKRHAILLGLERKVANLEKKLADCSC